MSARHRALLGSAAILSAIASALVAGPGAPLMAQAAPSMQLEFPLRTMNSMPTGIVTGPDGNLWDVDRAGVYVDRLTPAGALSSFRVSYGGGCDTTVSNAITVGPDGNLWFTQDCLYDSTGHGLPSGNISVVTTSGAVTHYRLPDAGPPYVLGPDPYGITAGPDGNLWFTESNGDHVGRITPSGVITEYSVPTAGADSRDITTGPDGNLWFVESAAAKVARLTTAGAITEYPIAAGAHPEGIAAGPDGNLWFTEAGISRIGRISTAGSGYVDYATPTPQSRPNGLVSGPGGMLWFTEMGANALASVTTAGTITEYPVGLPAPFDLATGPDGNLWFTAGSNDPRPPYTAPISWVGRLPLTSCGDLSDGVSSSRVAPGGQDTVSVGLKNCGVPALTSVTTTTTVAPPQGCASAPSIASFTATLAYGQAATGGATVTAPSCVGAYVITSTAKVGSTVVNTSTTSFVVSNGAGSHLAGDFNGDGYNDVAIADSGGTGAVFVTYGSSSGVSVNGTQRFDPSTPGMPSPLQNCMASRSDINFGMSLAAGDFNGDGYADLAVGVDCWNAQGGAPGGVVILWGSPIGLTTQGSAFLPSPSAPTSVAGAGWALATGDFNHDGYADLAVGAPFDQVGSATRDGSFSIWSGSAGGLTLTTVFSSATPGIPGPPAVNNDELGWAFAAGDFNHDGFADLAVSRPGRGGTTVLYGSSSGLTTSGGQYLQSFGPENSQSLAAGDFNGDGYADLAVGSKDQVHTAPYQGIVEVHYGGSSGLGNVNFKSAPEFWVTKTGMPTVSGGAPNHFGYSLAAGDFNHDGRVDLAVSADGGVYVLRGGALKLGTKNSQYIPDGTVQQGLAAADVNGSGFADLFIGYPNSGLAPSPVYVHNGASSGVVAAAAVTFYEGASGVTTIAPATEESGFGGAFSAPGSKGGHN